MAYKLGVDLIEKARFSSLLNKPGLKSRFSAAELAFAEQSGRPEEALAAAFAVKEAFFKAAGGVLADTRGIFWQAELCRSEQGRPYLKLPQALQARLRAAGFAEAEVSLSHDKTQVLAAVLLSGAGENGAQIAAQLPPIGFVPMTDEISPIDEQIAASWLPLRDCMAHKGSFGHVLVVGGSANYPGAPRLAAEGALHAGAGLVTLAAPQDIKPLSAEVICCPLYAPEGFLDERSADLLAAVAADKTVVIGMGMGRAPATAELCAGLFALPAPKVIDADALFALAALGIKPQNAVLTPHEGEMARLLKTTAAEVRADRLAAVQKCAAQYRSVVVLKGHKTLIADAEGRVWQNTCGNPGMACGGSGDVLAGIIGAWLAQGMPPLQAAAFGVFLHGLAGDFAAAELSEYALCALDIVRFLPMAYKRLLVVKNDKITAKNNKKVGE